MRLRAIDWGSAIGSLQGAVRSVRQPWVAGHLRPGSDLDVLVILRPEAGDAAEFAMVLDSARQALAMLPHRFAIHQRFSQFPAEANDLDDVNAAPIHFMLYPDKNA